MEPASLGRTDDGAAGHALDDGVAGGVVVVMVGGEDMGQHPALLVQRRQQLLGVGRIDRGGRLGLRIVDEHAVIVAPRRELMDFQVEPLRLRRFFRLRAGTLASPRWGLKCGAEEIENEV